MLDDHRGRDGLVGRHGLERTGEKHECAVCEAAKPEIVFREYLLIRKEAHEHIILRG